jgi:hypothetical protein
MMDDGFAIIIPKSRDYEYISNRLYGDSDAFEAIERLQQIGRKEEADELLEMAKIYGDRLREFRLRLRLGKGDGQ